MNNIEGQGYLGVVLMRSIGKDYQTVQEWLDWIRAYCNHNGYTITVTKDGHAKPAMPVVIDED